MNIFWTNLPDLENHFEKMVELISSSSVVVYLLDSLMDCFWARALQRLVLPVPGRSCNNTTLLQHTMIWSTPLSSPLS